MRPRDDAISQTSTKVDPSENLKWFKFHYFVTCISVLHQREIIVSTCFSMETNIADALVVL